jgi:hypothetical protein
MKKLQLSIATLTSIFYLASCSAAGTQVRLLELSYSLPGSQTEAARLNEKNLPTKKNADSSEYIFPGDILTFTVKLEDPTFEFISLLAIKFNGVTIRANTNDSIVTTSDCGANICVNFPFEVSADVTEYTVEEVKFAKLSSESGINAIIDNQSQNSLVLDIYDELIFPNVQYSVDLLNNSVSELEFYTGDENLTGEEWNFISNPYSGGRGFYIDGISNVVNGNEFHVPEVRIYGPLGLTFITFTSLGVGLGEGLVINNNGYLKDGNYYPIISFMFFHERYKDTSFSSIGNDIYINVLGVSYLVITINNNMKVNLTPKTYNQ